MQVRLAFSIAVETDAEIFLVDEALAVGDMEFRQKCLDKLREFKKEKKASPCRKCLLKLLGRVS